MIDAAFIAHEEGYVDRPYVPPGDNSGITIGYGEDLGQKSLAEFHELVDAVLPDPAISRLAKCLGLKGAAARAVALSSSVQNIRITKGQAITMLQMHTVPLYYALACKTYPGLEHMPDEVQTALTSLAVNRGGIPMLSKNGESPEGESNDSDRYDGERAIRQFIGEGKLDLVASELRTMGEDVPGSLWPGPDAPNPGLRGRRIREAQLIERWLATKVAA